MGSDPTDSPAAKPRRRWWQFSLRLVLVLVTLSTLPLGWLAMKLREAETQKQAVAAWVELDVDVEYSNRPRVPRWLGKWVLDLMGKDAYYVESISTFFHQFDAHPLRDEHFAALEEIDGIERLELDKTEVTDATLGRLTHFGDLELLGLAETRVTDAGMAYVGQCTKLAHLALEETRITDAGIAHLSGLTELVQLDLRGTQVTDAGLRHVRGLTKLKMFGLPLSLGDAGVACLEDMTELEYLFLGTRVTDDALRHLRKMDELESLYVNAPITGEGLVHLTSLSALEHLDLSETEINDQTVVLLKDLPQVRLLDLSETLVTDAGLTHLRNCTGLRVLAFSGPYVTPEGVAELQKALPNCEIGLEPWQRPRVGVDVFFPEKDDRLVDSRAYADGSRGFHLGRQAHALYLVHRPGPPDPHFANLYVVETLDVLRPTRFDRLLAGDDLCKTILDYIEAALSNDGVMHYDDESRLIQATREEILQRHGKKRGELLLQLRVVWEELRQRLAE